MGGVKVGKIYVPFRLAGTALYLEHWVLSPNYVYPSEFTGASMKIVSGNSSYSDQEDFFGRVRFGPGSRYIQMIANEWNSLPVAR